MLDIYAAGEAPLPGIDSRALCAKIKGSEYVGTLDAAVKTLSSKLKEGDLLITLGAGSITQLGPLLINQLNR